MDDINSIVRNKSQNKNNNISSIENIINKRDFDEFKEYILYGNFNMEIDMKQSEMNHEPVLLYRLLNSGLDKEAKLLLADIYHKDNLNTQYTKSKDTIKKYLNLNYTKKVISINSNNNGLTFFGMNLNNLSSTGESIIEDYFLNSSYFDEIKDNKIIYYCVQFNYFKFLSLISKYRANDCGITDGINSIDNDSKMTPLFYLVTLIHCSDDWIRLLFTFENIDPTVQCMYNNKKCNVKEIISNKEWLNIVNSFSMSDALASLETVDTLRRK